MVSYFTPNDIGSTAMKRDEIGAILSQAAQLHSNLCSAIDRSLHHDDPCRRVAFPSPYHKLTYDGYKDDDDNEVVPFAVEARSLSSIRDALEVLEEQLQCLQSLTDCQRVEKKATLVELEESRAILIRRLKQHQGREIAVIQEAFSFAGEPQEENESLLGRSYTMPERLSDFHLRHQTFERDDNEAPDVFFFSGSCRKESHRNEKLRLPNDGHRSPCKLLNFLKTGFISIFSCKLAKASAKCLLAVGGAAAVIILSNAAYSKNVHRNLTTLEGRRRVDCPKGWIEVQGGVERCMLMEPFKEEV